MCGDAKRQLNSPIQEVCRDLKRKLNSPIQEREGGKIKVHWQSISERREDTWSGTTDLVRSGDERHCGESVTEGPFKRRD